MDGRFKNWEYPDIEEEKLTKYNWVVKHKDRLRLGYKTDIGAFTYINAKNGVTIEDLVQIGSHCSIYSVSTIDKKEARVIFKKNCKVGSHSVIMPGVTIGENAVVGACSFVNTDIPANSTAFGVPAKVVKTLTGKAAREEFIGMNDKKDALPHWPYFADDEVEAVAAVLRSGKVNYWTGDEGRQFEKEFADYANCKYAIALANGTVALELALHALGIGPGDEVIVPSRTFIASASCVVMRGATPVMADIDPVSQNLTAETIRPVLSKKTKAVIAVHLSGWPCDMAPIMSLARKHGLKVIEDCAQAHGAEYKGRPVGSLGDIAAFSFCQDKIMTTGGEGGMLTLNNKALWKKAWSFKDHGKAFDAVYKKKHPNHFRWIHESFGTNWRMTEMQSAIGRIQLKKLPLWVEARRKNAATLSKYFSRIPALRVTVPPPDIGHSYYKYYAFVRPEMLKKGWTRDRIIEAVNARGVACFYGSCSEIYLEKAFDRDGLRPKTRMNAAKELGETSLMFLAHPTLSMEDMENTCSVVEKVMQTASR
ncbi:MAG: DegT/DnrJ/EryC1/StrS family aminotransferase [Deltaproteobacteria bacterium]|nr:DegT/DnrJ/EryC1/StrS family aminotransferase [Deltaproteobacteria bacterium]